MNFPSGGVFIQCSLENKKKKKVLYYIVCKSLILMTAIAVLVLINPKKYIAKE